MPDPLPLFKKSIIIPHSTIIVGLSGGPDSIYLLHHLYQIKAQLNLKLIAAHLDHEWQASSKIAVQICKEQCDKLGIPLVLKKLSELRFEVKWNGSQEELGRNARRHFFATIAQEYQASAIALAHHQQDQHETFFIRLVRGSSLNGLVGMREHQGLYIRPMLNCSKQQILDYLETHNIAYYMDPTNSSDTYLRNRIRNHVIPALQQTDQRFEQKLDATMQHLAHLEDFLSKQVMQTLATISTDQGIDTQKFLSLHSVLQQRILLDLMIAKHVIFNPSQKLFKEIMRFLEKSSSRSHAIHTSWTIQKNKTHFMIQKTYTTVP